MSNNLMDTEVGGETPQYESIQTVTKPPKKEAGQFGDVSETTTSVTQPPSTTSSSDANQAGITPADKIRYGQSIQEGGMGGKTNATGHATTEGGFGRTEALEDQPEGFAKQRREQGYGGARDMDRNIGA